MSKDLKTTLETAISKAQPNIQESLLKQIENLFEAGGKSFETIMVLLRDSNAPLEIRTTACWVLGELGDKQAIDPLMDAFSGHEEDLWWPAMRALVSLGDRQSISGFIKQLREAKEMDRRAAAAYALGFLSDASRAVEPLIHALSDLQEDPYVRGHAAEALGRIGDRRALNPLIAALRDESVDVRFWSAYSLGELGDPKAIEELEFVGASDTSVLPKWGSVAEECRRVVEKLKNAQRRT